MSNYITLLGAEDVQRASNRMTAAAEEMQRAASTISFALEQHQRALEDWLNRLDGILQDRIHEVRLINHDPS